jgi:hypothetical protein
MKSQNLRKDIDVSTKQFINDMIFVVDAVYQKNRKDLKFGEFRDKFSIARRENPNGLLEIVGPYLWKYKDDIISQNVKAFLDNDFVEDVESFRVSHPNENLDTVHVFLNQCKQSWGQFLPREQDVLFKKIRNMLSQYAKYASATKALETL